MAKQVKIKVLDTERDGPFQAVEVGEVYSATQLERDEYDAYGDWVDEPSVAFTDEDGDLCVAHIRRHEGSRFEFV